jgi:hypothetical protein
MDAIGRAAAPIMLRLVNGGKLDLTAFAANCRTSYDMLQRFYLSHLTPEMNRGGLVHQGKQLGRQI